MDMNEKTYVAAVINYFSGTEMVKPSKINEDVARVAYEALQGARICSAAMDLVPRPTMGKPGIKYIIKQLVGIGKRIASGDEGVYYVCKISVAIKYKSMIRIALSGCRQ